MVELQPARLADRAMMSSFRFWGFPPSLVICIVVVVQRIHISSTVDDLLEGTLLAHPCTACLRPRLLLQSLLPPGGDGSGVLIASTRIVSQVGAPGVILCSVLVVAPCEERARSYGPYWIVRTPGEDRHCGVVVEGDIDDEVDRQEEPKALPQQTSFVVPEDGREVDFDWECRGGCTTRVETSKEREKQGQQPSAHSSRLWTQRIDLGRAGRAVRLSCIIDVHRPLSSGRTVGGCAQKEESSTERDKEGSDASGEAVKEGLETVEAAEDST